MSSCKITVIKLKSLILAQIERWRHALHMQVERQRGGNPGGERRTGAECIGPCPRVGDDQAKDWLIPHELVRGKTGTRKTLALEERPMAGHVGGGGKAHQGH